MRKLRKIFLSGLVIVWVLLFVVISVSWFISYKIDYYVELSVQRFGVMTRDEPGRALFAIYKTQQAYIPGRKPFAFRFSTTPRIREGLGGSEFEHERLGIAWEKFGSYRGGGTGWAVRFPYRYLLCVLAMAPLVPLRYAYKKQKRKRLNLCIYCGYDLRATPERCPECGVVVADSKSRIGPLDNLWLWSKRRAAIAGLLGISVIAATYLIFDWAYGQYSFRSSCNSRSKDWSEIQRPPNRATMKHLAQLHASSLMISDLSQDAPTVFSIHGIQFPNVKQVVIRDTVSTDDWVQLMTDPSDPFLNLDTIYIDITNLSDRGLDYLSNSTGVLKKLKQMKFEENLNYLNKSHITDAGFSKLCGSSVVQHVESLDLENIDLSAISIGALCQSQTGFKNLRSLTVPRRTDLAGYKLLSAPESGLKNLERLVVPYLPSPNYCLEIARADGALNHIKILEIRNSSAEYKCAMELLQGGGLQSLETLDLYNTKITDEFIIELANHANILPALRKIDIKGTKATPQGAARLLRARPNLEIVTSMYWPKDWRDSK